MSEVLENKEATAEPKRGLLNPDQALWLPPGSCRFLIAVMCAALVYLSASQEWGEPYVNSLLVLFTFVSKSYFDDRRSERSRESVRGGRAG